MELHGGSIFTSPSSLCSVPCGPANVQADVDCASGGLTIGWNASRNAEGYIAVISDSDMQESYNTTQPKLSISTLECGQEYTVKVMSFNRTCVSFPSVLPVREGMRTALRTVPL